MKRVVALPVLSIEGSFLQSQYDRGVAVIAGMMKRRPFLSVFVVEPNVGVLKKNSDARETAGPSGHV